MRQSSSLHHQCWFSCFTSSSSSSSSSIPNQKLRFSHRIIPISRIFSLSKPHNPKSKSKSKPKPEPNTVITSSHRKSNYFTREPTPPRKSLPTRRRTAVYDTVVELQKSLNPIITKDENQPKRRSKSAVSVSPRGGVKLRTNTPRVRRKSERPRGVAVVKCSRDPRRDFRESMVEMIVENNLTENKELEELLVCYLSLNSEEYHDLIIGVFKQLWFDFVAPYK